MKERPILFKGEMVRAILENRKMQTRRIVKFPHENPLGMWEPMTIGGPKGGRLSNGATIPEQAAMGHTRTGDVITSPYGQPGDRFWVREAHAQVFEIDIPKGRAVGPVGTAGSPGRPDLKCRYIYRADGEMPDVQWHHVGDSQPVRWERSTRMPRWASRITLEITGVRVERLRDISEADAKAEGVEPPECCYAHYHGFSKLWQSINGPSSWDENPWVWCIEFKRVQS